MTMLPVARSAFQKYKSFKKKLNIGIADPKATDVYIVAYPKSGINWYCNILANLALIESGRTERATFASGRLYIPSAQNQRILGDPIWSSPPARFIRTHEKRSRDKPNVIYLARHPIPCMKSFYNYKRYRGLSASVSFDAFCRDKKFGIPAWNAHVKSWLMSKDRGEILHVTRYEDLERQPETEIANLSRNFGWNVKYDNVQNALSESSANTMKNHEQFYRKFNPRYEGVFVKSGFDLTISDSLSSYISEQCEGALDLLNYDK